MAIYTIVIAAVWQTSGFVMAMFLAGLRGIDNEIIKAAQIDGASTLHHLSPHHHPDAAAGVPLRLRHAQPPRDQVL
jgi:ABC-type polysaccharide transport system permease subunit